MSSVRVPAKVKAEVEAKLRACIKAAEDHFIGQTFAFPKVLYTKRGVTAGTATLSTWTVNFNSVLLMENLEDFINRTVPHEMAHLIDYQINPENFERGNLRYTRRGVSRGKRSVHGPSWKRIMMLFGAPTSAYHSYDVSNAKVKKRGQTKFEYVCKTCGEKMHLGAKRHAKMASGMAKYWIRGCGRHAGYQFVGVEGPAPAVTLPKAANAPTPKPAPAAKAPKAGSKMERALVIYKDLAGKGHGRKMTIQRFMDVLDMSKAGASTYYYNCQKKVG